MLARLRARLRRERAAAEEEGEERGELNLVPYLDIVVNTVIFLLATTAFALPAAHLSVQAPSTTPPVSEGAAPASGERPGLVVAVSRTGFIVSEAGRVLPGEAGRPTVRCAAALDGAGRCGAYDFARLAALARELKGRQPRERRVVVMADPQISYQVVVRTMDAVRGTSTRRCTGADGCLFDRVVLGTGLESSP